MNANYIQSIRIDWSKVEEDSYLRGIGALTHMGELEFKCPVTLLAGENGSGKSTLLEAIAVAYGFNPEGGTRNYRFSTFDDVSELRGALRMTKGFRRPGSGYFFRAESFFNVASKAEDYRDGERKEIYYARYGANPCMNSRMARASLHIFSHSAGTGSTSWTSLRQLSRYSASSRC